LSDSKDYIHCTTLSNTTLSQPIFLSTYNTANFPQAYAASFLSLFKEGTEREKSCTKEFINKHRLLHALNLLDLGLF
jgi:hypothetical protein